MRELTYEEVERIANTSPCVTRADIHWLIRNTYAEGQDSRSEEVEEWKRNAGMVRHCVSECDKGHKFAHIPSHPAKSEQEWHCPHCLLAEVKELREALGL